MSTNQTKKEHILPQVVLRRFADDKECLHVYDLVQRKNFPSNIRDVGAERYYYSLPTPEGMVSLEPFFGEFESKYNLIIKRITENLSLNCLEKEEKQWLSAFVAIQFLRSRQFRTLTEDIQKHVIERMLDFNFPDWRNLGDVKITKEALKISQGKAILESFEKYTEFVELKDILLFQTDCADFLIGDNAIAFHNDQEYGPYGNIGFAVPGIQLYLPITPSLILAFWCPSILNLFREGNRKFKIAQVLTMLTPNLTKEIRKSSKSKLNKMRSRIEERELIIKCAANGDPIYVDLEKVKFFNFLQVSNATRQVFSKSGDFTMVREILKGQDEGRFSKGPILKF